MKGIGAGMGILAAGAAAGAGLGLAAAAHSGDRGMARKADVVGGVVLGLIAAGVAGVGVAIFSPEWRTAGVTAAAVGLGLPAVGEGVARLRGA